MSESAGVTNTLDAKRSTSSVAHAREAAVSVRYSDTVVAYTILRLSFGANILLHGLSRLMNRAGFLAYLNHYFEKTPLVPAGMLPAVGTVLPWVEASLGLLLLLGLATGFSLIAGALVYDLLSDRHKPGAGLERGRPANVFTALSITTCCPTANRT